MQSQWYPVTRDIILTKGNEIYWGLYGSTRLAGYLRRGWLNTFMNQHPLLTTRTSQVIKRLRAEATEEDLKILTCRDYCPKQGPIDIQYYCSQQGRHTQQSTGVTLFVTEETYWPIPTSIGSVRCVFLVVVTTADWFVDCVPMGYQTLGTIRASTRHITDVPSQKPCSRKRLDSSPFSEFPKCDSTWLEILASPMVQLSGIRLHISP